MDKFSPFSRENYLTPEQKAARGKAGAKRLNESRQRRKERERKKDELFKETQNGEVRNPRT